MSSEHTTKVSPPGLRRRAPWLRLLTATVLLAGVTVSPPTTAGAAGVGDAAPPFTLFDTDGQPVSIECYRGSVVWLNFGATW